MSISKLYDFLSKPIAFQQQAMFEFYYPFLFEENSFLIEQLNFPQVTTNTGFVYLDGYKIPVHSTADFGNEITFTMYAEENDFSQANGKYFDIIESFLNKDHNIYLSTHNSQILNSPLIAKIYPLPSNYDFYKTKPIKRDDTKAILLYNALIKTISLSGGFASNSITLSKYDVTLTYSFIDFPERK